MLKKKYNLQKQLFLKYNYKKQFLSQLLKKSFSKNHFLQPSIRLSFMYTENFLNDILYRFNTYQKLLCLITSSPKVNSRKYHYSRFFLNKQLEKLVISNTLK